MSIEIGATIDPLNDFNKCRDINAAEAIALLRLEGFRFWSWGANAFVTVKTKALRFKVNGHHHKGHVYLSVNGCDLFDVVLTSTMGTVKKVMTDIYFDDLFDRIDVEIERIPEYQK